MRLAPLKNVKFVQLGEIDFWYFLTFVLKWLHYIIKQQKFYYNFTFENFSYNLLRPMKMQISICYPIP